MTSSFSSRAIFAQSGPFTAMHNALFDLVQPKLSLSAWSVLCVIVRRTRGWGKKYDAISYEQIKAATGIKSTATIAKALNELLSDVPFGKPILRRQKSGERTASCREATRYALNPCFSIDARSQRPDYRRGDEAAGEESSPQSHGGTENLEGERVGEGKFSGSGCASDFGGDDGAGALNFEGPGAFGTSENEDTKETPISDGVENLERERARASPCVASSISSSSLPASSCPPVLLAAVSAATRRDVGVVSARMRGNCWFALALWSGRATGAKMWNWPPGGGPTRLLLPRRNCLTTFRRSYALVPISLPLMQSLQNLLPPLADMGPMGGVMPPLRPDSSAPPRARVANGPTGSPTSATPDGKAGEEVAARHATIEKMIALFCAAYDREPPDAVERKLKVGVWAIALSRVPVAELLPLARSELAERESSFFPVPADLLKRWQSGTRLTPAGAANADAYLPYSPSRRPELPEPLPPLQIEPEELKRRLRAGAPSRTESSRPAEDDDKNALLLDVVRAGNIALERCSPAQVAELGAFGRWWLANHPQLDLCLANFAGTYAVFSATRNDGLNTESTEELEKHREN